jgi:hypothetical protein
MSYNAFKEINNKGEYYELWFIRWFIFVGVNLGEIQVLR